MRIILLAVASAIAAIVGFYVYMGGFAKPEVRSAEVDALEFVYATHQGGYENLAGSWDAFKTDWEAAGFAACDSLAVYLDTPDTPKDDLRTVLGCRIDHLSEEEAARWREAFPVFKTPAAEAVVSSFPYRNPLSFFLGPIMVYPEMNKSIAEKGDPRPSISLELYGPEDSIERIRFVMPFDMPEGVLEGLYGVFEGV